jgi:hypothetical protein
MFAMELPMIMRVVFASMDGLELLPQPSHADADGQFSRSAPPVGAAPPSPTSPGGGATFSLQGWRSQLIARVGRRALLVETQSE